MKKNNFKINKYKNDNIISSTNRELYNPPKKNSKNEDSEKVDDDFNNIILENNLDSKIDNKIILDKDKIYSSSNKMQSLFHLIIILNILRQKIKV